MAISSNARETSMLAKRACFFSYVCFPENPIFQIPAFHSQQIFNSLKYYIKMNSVISRILARNRIFGLDILHQKI